MFQSFVEYFGGRKDSKQATRNAIIDMRQQLQIIEKKEAHLQKKIDEEMQKARDNAVSNKTVAAAALRRKKAAEVDLDRLQKTRFQLEGQVSTLENASFNVETVAAMKKGANALKVVHGNLNPDKIDTLMAGIHEEMQTANELSEALANPVYGSGMDIDEDELKQELADLEQEDLNERLASADPVPITHPAGSSRVASPPAPQRIEADEDEELKQLQAALAM